MKRLIALLGLLAGFACALVFACKSSPVDVDAGVEVEAGMRGGPVVGSNPGQPFGPCPIGTDCYGSNWQKERTLFLQQIALALDASAGPGSGIFLNDAGVLTLAVPYQPALDGGFPAASTGQFFVQLSIGPGAATITGDLHCSTSTPGQCTLTAIQGVPVDGGGGAAGYVLTWVDGGWSPQPAAVASYGLDLAVNPDGGSGQVLVAKHGNDGGQALADFTQGWTVDPSVPTWGVTLAAPLDAATAPAGIYLTPAPPNAAATTTAGRTPGSVHVVCPKPLSTGTLCGMEVDYDGGSVASLTPFGPTAGGLCLAPGATCTESNAIVWTDNSNGPVYFNTPTSDSNAEYSFSIAGTQYLSLNRAGFNAHGYAWDWDNTVLTPRFGELQQNADTPTTTITVHGQGAYALATGANKAGGPETFCGGPSAPGGADGYVSFGSGYTIAGNAYVCNQTVRIDSTGATFLAPASLPGIPAQGSNGAGELVADGPGATGGANWLGSGGYITEFAPGGNGNAFGSPFTTTANVIGGHTTAVGDFVTMQVPIPTGQTAAITLTVDGRVTVAGATSVVGDSVSFATFAALTNPSGTPRVLANHGTDQSWTYYDTSQTTEISSISTSASPGFFNVVVTQAGAPNVGATILWTMAYQARLY